MTFEKIKADILIIGTGAAGQSFDRTVHKGDLTGIEIISRLTEQRKKSP